LAYDFDKWGTSAPNMTCKYTKDWIKAQFGSLLNESELEKAYDIVEGYTRLNSIRRPEALSPDTYHPTNYHEAEWIMGKAIAIENTLSELEQYKENPSFYELVYYPAAASANQLKLMIYAGKNKLYATQGKITANKYAVLMHECVAKDDALREAYHLIADGKWNGMMMSEHIGFVHWNDEECRYPIYHYVEPANKPRMIVSPKYGTQYSMGGDWTRKTIVINDIRDYGEDSTVIEITNGSDKSFSYKVECDNPNVRLSRTEGIVSTSQEIEVTVINKDADDVVSMCIRTSFAHVNVEIPLRGKHLPKLIAIEADEYVEKSDEYVLLKPYGKYVAGVKALPHTEDFPQGKSAPHISYNFEAENAGEYEAVLYIAPSNPLDIKNELKVGFSLNNGEISYLDAIGKDYISGAPECKEWCKTVLDNVHKIPVSIQAQKGTNTITIYACSAPVVLERITIRDINTVEKEGYIGILPKENI
jgi:hypothetical protein